MSIYIPTTGSGGNGVTQAQLALKADKSNPSQSFLAGSGSFTSLVVNSKPVLSSSSTIYVNSSMTVSAINTIIANTAYKTVIFESGTYTLTSALLVQRSNIILDGNYSTFNLGTNVNQPNICVGDIATNPATITYTNVSIRNFKMDGQKASQTSEFWSAHPWVPASCVVGVKSTQLYITECNLDNARSGGLTLIDCNDVSVDKCSSTLNYFDAYTFYGSRNVRITNSNAYTNYNGAGVSVDNNNNDCLISNCNLSNNKESIFARDSYNFVVSNCTLNNNSQMAVFLAGYSDIVSDRGPEKWVISNNTIIGNAAQGLWLQSCKKFSITGNTICNNTGNGIELGNDTPANAAGTCSYNSISSNTICNNASGIYNNPNNDYTSGARDNYLSYNVVKNNTTDPYAGDFSSCYIIDTPNIVIITDSVTSITNTATTWTNTGFFVSINRRNPSAKVKINFNGQLGYRGANFGVFSISRLYRTITTELSGNTYGLALIAVANDFQTSFEWTDTLPNIGTDAIVYQIVTKTVTAGSCIFNNSGVVNCMTAEELI